MESARSTALEIRRKFGQFSTPHDIAHFIAHWTIKKPNSLILDPCTGSGALLFEAIERLKSLGNANPSNQIFGVDIDPFVLEDLATRLKSRQNLVQADFLSITPPKTDKGSNDGSILPFVDAVVCNPPFTRHHRLTRAYKSRLAETIGAEAGCEISKQSSVYAYFIMHASRFLRENGRMAFITPSSFLDVNYGIALKQFIVRNLRIITLILFSEKTLVFPKALTTTCILLLQKEKCKDHIAKLLKINTPLTSGEFLEVTKHPSLLKKRGAGSVVSIPQALLDPSRKWSQYFNEKSLLVPGLVPLKNIAYVRRGIATGANEFFVLSDDMVRQFEIEPDFLRPIIAKARDARFFDFTGMDFRSLRENGRKAWLVSCDREKFELRGTKLLEYIKQGETQGYHMRHLAKSRKPWYSSERRSPTPIIFTYMSRKQLRFIYNKAKTLTLNTFHSVYLKRGTVKGSTELKAFLAYLNSQRAQCLLRAIGRMYGGGLMKVEPKELEQLPVIDVRRIGEHDVHLLANLFGQLCKAARKGNDSSIRKQIDEIVALLMNNP